MLSKKVGPFKTTSKGPTYLLIKALKIGLELEGSKLKYVLGMWNNFLHLSPTFKS